MPLGGVLDIGLVYLLVVLHRTSLSVAGRDAVRAVSSSTSSYKGGQTGCARLDENVEHRRKEPFPMPLPCD